MSGPFLDILSSKSPESLSRTALSSNQKKSSSDTASLSPQHLHQTSGGLTIRTSSGQHPNLQTAKSFEDNFNQSSSQSNDVEIKCSLCEHRFPDQLR